ncbi:MAG: GNAT family N-acetyltransferase [Terriglobales bacterium]
MRHIIRQFSLERGSFEIEYMEQYFPEFQEKKTAGEIRRRLQGRPHLILMSLAPTLDDTEQLIPVAFKVGHELRGDERDPALAALADRLRDCIPLQGRRVFYSWIGGTREDWRGHGHYRALTEEQEAWALQQGYERIVVKTKNKFHAMRATLDHLRFDIVYYERHGFDNAESKIYLHKQLSPGLIRAHLTEREVQQAA